MSMKEGTRCEQINRSIFLEWWGPCMIFSEPGCRRPEERSDFSQLNNEVLLQWKMRWLAALAIRVQVFLHCLCMDGYQKEEGGQMANVWQEGRLHVYIIGRGLWHHKGGGADVSEHVYSIDLEGVLTLGFWGDRLLDRPILNVKTGCLLWWNLIWGEDVCPWSAFHCLLCRQRCKRVNESKCKGQQGGLGLPDWTLPPSRVRAFGSQADKLIKLNVKISGCGSAQDQREVHLTEP